jgi:hypothetical protein
MLGIEGAGGGGSGAAAASGDETTAATPDSPLRRKGTFTQIISKAMDRKRSGSLALSHDRGLTTSKLPPEVEEELACLRGRVAELELSVYELETKAEERERVVEHYRAKVVRMKQTNRNIRDQAKGMFKALLDGDSRKLDDMIRSHYSTLDPEASAAAAAAVAGMPRDGSMLKAPDGGMGSPSPSPSPSPMPDGPTLAFNAFAKKDSMFTSHEMMSQPLTRSRQASDPLDSVSSSSPAGARVSKPAVGRERTPEVGNAGAQEVALSGSCLSIVFKPGTNEILRGSLPDIVHYLININRDRNLMARFLLLFRQFMTPSDLLENLKVVMEACPPSEKAAGGQEDTVLYIQPLPGQSTVRQRVGYLLNRWIQDYFEEDFEQNAPLRKSFGKLCAEVDPSVVVLLDMQVEKSKEQRRQMLVKQGQSMPQFGSETAPDRNTSNGGGDRGGFLTTRKNTFSSGVQLLALHPLEVARQMTLIEFELLENIEPLDFLRASKDSNKATTVKGLTNRFNRTSAWIASEVIQNPTAKERAQKIKFFISLAQSALDIKNFNLLMSVLAGLNYASVQRLKKSWKLVSPKLIQNFQSLEAVMTSAKNYGVYRAALAGCEWPKLPYFGVFLRDLQFIDVGNDTWIGAKEDKLVNFEKVAMMEALLNELDTFKTYNEFPFTGVPVLQAYLKQLPAMDEDALHKMSVHHEPINTSGPNYLDEAEDSPRSDSPKGASNVVSPRDAAKAASIL